MADVVDRTDRPKAIVSLNPSPTKEARRAIIGARRWAGGLVLAFVAVAALTGLGATDGIDEGISRLALAVASEPLDLPASIFNIVGQMEVTALIAVILSFVWWRRRGARGLVPMLLFAGVAIEVILKHIVQHPGPPAELSRSIPLLPFAHGSSPYSFPSGHMLRVTFLTALIAPRWAFWTLVAAMALTRIYLQQHWASDVVGGFLLGAALAGLAASLYAAPDA
jgi:undecaprenyl-diphosphatase